MKQTKRWTAILLVVVMISSLFPMEVFAEEKNGNTGAYGSVIEKYIEAIEGGWTAAQFEAADLNAELAETSNTTGNTGYAYKDVDGDGTPELFIVSGASYGASTGMFWDMYRLANGEPQRVAKGKNRDALYLCTNGKIKEVASGGYNYNSELYFNYANGGLNFIEKVFYNRVDYPSSPWMYTDNAKAWLDPENMSLYTQTNEANYNEVKNKYQGQAINFTNFDKYVREPDVAFAGGNGSVENPYQIATAEQLDAVRNNLNANYKLVADIDLSSYEAWKPIGKNSENAFAGTFDGDNHTISNLKITSKSINDEYKKDRSINCGLFGTTKDEAASFKNIKIKNVDININDLSSEGFKLYCGSLAGWHYGETDNISVSGIMNIANYSTHATLGGLIGYGHTATNATNNITIQIKNLPSASVGGILGIGQQYSSGKLSIPINNCINNGDISVEADSYAIGGISPSAKIISRSTNNGNITGKSNCNSKINALIGGIVVQVASQGKNKITECINHGNITNEIIGNIDSIFDSAGIICGSALGTVKVDACLNNGSVNIKHTNDVKKISISGICGSTSTLGTSTGIEAKDITVSNCQSSAPSVSAYHENAAEADQAYRICSLEGATLFNNLAWKETKVNGNNIADNDSEEGESKRHGKSVGGSALNEAIRPEAESELLSKKLESNTEIVNYWTSNHMGEFGIILNVSSYPYYQVMQSFDTSFAGKLVWFAEYWYAGHSLKDTFSGETSKNDAKKVLMALIHDQETEIKGLSEAQTALKYGGYINTAIQEYAVAEGIAITGKDYDIIKDYLSSSTFEQTMSTNGYDKVVEEITTLVPQTSKNNVNKALKNLENSETLGKVFSGAGYAFKVVDMTKMSIDNLYEYDVMRQMDENILDVLKYMSENAYVDFVKEAAEELYNEAHTSYEEGLKEVVSDTAIEGGYWLAEEGLNFLNSKLWYLELWKTTADVAIQLGNTFFNTADLHNSKNAMRTLLYAGVSVSSYITENLQVVNSDAPQNQIDEAATKVVTATRLLWRTNVLGEERCQLFAEKSWQPTLSDKSKRHTAILKDIEPIFFDPQSTFDREYQSYIAEFSCPVNVEVYDKDNNLVLTMEDGKEVNGDVNGITYETYYNSMSNDYNKIINVDKNAGYSFKAVGRGKGVLYGYFSTIDSTGKLITEQISNIPVDKDTVISIPSSASNGSFKYTINNNEGEYIKKSETVATTKDEFNRLEKITLTAEFKNEMLAGEKQLIKAQFTPENATTKEMSWSTTDENIAIVNSDGLVTAVGEGEVTIMALSAQGDVKGEITLKVNPVSSLIKVTGISLDKSQADLFVGNKMTLTPAITPDNASNKTITWTSSNEKVATVKDGVITAVKEGSAIITVTTSDGNYKATCKVTVKKESDSPDPGATGGNTTNTTGGNTTTITVTDIVQRAVNAATGIETNVYTPWIALGLCGIAIVCGMIYLKKRTSSK